MSTTATKQSQKSAAQTRKSFAVQYLEDLVFEIMLNTGQAAKSREVASALEGIIKLHPKFIRRTLFQSDRFEMEERRWNLALRTMTHLSFDGSIEHTLRDYGKPMSRQAIQNEMAMVHRRAVDFYQEILPATLQRRAQYWQAPDGCWLLKDWILDVSESDADRCFLRNFFLDQEEARPLVETLLGTRMAADQPPIEMAIKLLRRAGQPVPNKVLAYVVWRVREGKLDPVEFLQECRQEARLLSLSGLTWGLQESVEEYDKDLKALSRKAEKEEDMAWAEEEEPEGPIVITPADVEEVHKLLKRRKRPQPTSLIAEAVFEYSPASRRFQESVDALTSALTLDSRFVRVGSQTWALPDMMPSHTDRVPESLLPVPVEIREDEADLELEDEGLEPVLVAWVHDPRYEDFGEEPEIDISPEQQPTDELRYILLYDHWKAGTLKVRVCDRRLYPSESDLLCATFVDKEKQKQYPVWLSYATSLLYGLEDWYAARKLRPGAVFTVTPGSMPDEFVVSYEDEVDEMAAISDERLKALNKLRRAAAKEEFSVLDIMQQALAGCEKGLPFMTLWAEVNVVRRTPRRVVASNLASYHCFYQKPANSDMWVFDERKVTQGRKKTKRKFVRRV